MLELVSRHPLQVGIRSVLLYKYRLRLRAVRVIQQRKDLVSIDSEVLDESVNGLFFIGDVLRRDNDVKSGRVIDENSAVAVEYRASRRRDWYLSDTVVLGARLVIIMPRDLQHIKANPQC